MGRFQGTFYPKCYFPDKLYWNLQQFCQHTQNPAQQLSQRTQKEAHQKAQNTAHKERQQPAHCFVNSPKAQPGPNQQESADFTPINAECQQLDAHRAQHTESRLQHNAEYSLFAHLYTHSTQETPDRRQRCSQQDKKQKRQHILAAGGIHYRNRRDKGLPRFSSPT